MKKEDETYEKACDKYGEERLFSFPRMEGRYLGKGLVSNWERRDGVLEEVISDEISFLTGTRGELVRRNNRWMIDHVLIVTADVPEMFLKRGAEERASFRFYDHNFNQITDEIWLVGEYLYAFNFALWYFGNNGVPDIEIMYGGRGDFHKAKGMSRLFRYIDGAFVMLSADWQPIFQWIACETDKVLEQLLIDADGLPLRYIGSTYTVFPPIRPLIEMRLDLIQEITDYLGGHIEKSIGIIGTWQVTQEGRCTRQHHRI